MANGIITKNGCRQCTERKRNDEGKLFCPHLQCIFEESDLKFWREVGGATLIDPKEA